MIGAWMLLLATGAWAEPPTPLTEAPGDVRPVRHWDVEHLHLAVTVDIEAGTVQGTTTHQVAPLPARHDTLTLHQVDLDIAEVRVDGAAIEGWRTEPGRLIVPLAAGEAHEVQVDFAAHPETGIHFRRAGTAALGIDEAWTQGEGEDHRHWFPSWDHPSDRFTLSVDVTARDGLHAVANGVLTGKAPAEPGWTTWSYALEHEVVNYLVALAVGDYTIHRIEGARIPLEVVAPSTLSAEAALAGTDRVAAMLPWFDEVLATPYPYPVYRQVYVQDFLYGGMENTSITILAGRLAVDHPWKEPRRAESVAAHEIAHQWFGDYVTCYGWRELWLNEGFATYWTNRWMEHAYGPAYAALRRRGAFEAALNTSRPMAARSWSRVDERPSTAVYTRGSTVLHMLEVHLGREVFDAGIARYLAEHGDSLVETAQLRRSLEEVGGAPLDWLFDPWVHRHGAPSFQVSHRHRGPTDDTPGELVVTLEQTTEGRPWLAPVEIEIGTDDGVVRRHVWVEEGRTRLSVALDAPPRWVVADPRRAVLAHWTQEQDPAAWAAAALDSPTWDARLQALHQLGAGPDTPVAVEALAEVAGQDDLDPDVRAFAVEALGQLRSEAALEALRPLADGPVPVRVAVARALGGQPRIRTPRALLDELLRDDHDDVARAALRALAAHDEDGAARTARRWLRGRPTDADQPVRRGALDVLGEHGTPRDLGLVLDHLDRRWPRGVRQSAATAAAVLIAREPDATARRRASRALEPLLDEADLRVRGFAIRALGEVGDDAAARRLQAFARTTRLEGQREAARDAANAIRGRDPDREPPAPDDLERLRERLDTLEERLEGARRWR